MPPRPVRPTEADVAKTKGAIDSLENPGPGWRLTGAGRQELSRQKENLENQKKAMEGTAYTTNREAMRQYETSDRPSSSAPSRLRSSPIPSPSGPGEIDMSPTVDLGKNWSFTNRTSNAADPSRRYVNLPNPQPARPSALHPALSYSGFSHKTAALNSGAVSGMNTRPTQQRVAELTWTGFQRGVDKSEVFIQLSQSVDYAIEVLDNAVIVRLPATKVGRRNNARHLDLQYFQTPLNRVDISSARGMTTVTIHVNRKVEPTLSVHSASDEQQIVTLGFANEK